MAHTVVISGGARGIGAAAVRLFAKEGHRVAFLYEKSEALAQALAAQSGALALRADVSNRAQVDAALLRVRRELGRIDVLINNAGIAQFRQFQDITEAQWRRVLDVNLTGAFHMTQAALPDMLDEKRGVILNVSSIWGLCGASCEVHYAASKAALIGFTRSLAKELGPSDIRVNCVAPGVIETDMNAGLSEADLQALRDETPLGRLGTPEEVAQALLFLAGDGASFITGQVLSPDGGMCV